MRQEGKDKRVKNMRKAAAVLLAVCFTASLSGPAGSAGNPLAPATVQAQDYYSDELFSPAQLDNLLAPIALYPDPLLAQVLLAATFVDEVDQAARWMRAHNDPNAIDYQPWDSSVKAVAHYPSVLYMMRDRIDWTIAVGQAYVNQSTDVMASVQHLRAMAYSAGHLVSNRHHQVIAAGDYIEVVPFEPEVIYVPAYDPDIAYFSRRSYFGLYPVTIISFGPAFPIGAWLNRGCDWGRRRIYYHGWQGRGWIARSRPHIHITNVYVNNSYANIQINRDIVRRNVNFDNLNRYTSVHREVNYNNLGRLNGGGSGNPDAGNGPIRRHPDVNASRGRPPVEQPTTQEKKTSRAREERPPAAREERSSRTREERAAEAKARSQTPPPPPRDLGEPPRRAFGADTGIGPRATTEREQISRARGEEPTPGRQDRGPAPRGERSKRPEPDKKAGGERP